MRRGTGTYRLFLCDLGIFQVLFDVPCLEKLKKLPIFDFWLYVLLTLTVEARFYKLQG